MIPPHVHVHPGELLEMILEDNNLSAGQLALACGVPASLISRVIHGHAGISSYLAIRLGKFFGTGPDIFLNMQRNYARDIKDIAHSERS